MKVQVHILTQNCCCFIRYIEEVSLENSTTTLFATTPSYISRPCSVSNVTVVIVHKDETTSAVGRHYNRITHNVRFVADTCEC